MFLYFNHYPKRNIFIDTVLVAEESDFMFRSLSIIYNLSPVV
jgi:hypothetical protein